MKNNFEWKDSKNFSVLEIDGFAKFQLEWVPEINRFLWPVREGSGSFSFDRETEKELSKLFPNFRKKVQWRKSKKLQKDFSKIKFFSE